MSFKAVLSVVILVLVGCHFSLGGNACGGVLEGNRGTLEFVDNDDSTSSNCIWIVKLLTRQTALVKLEDLSEGSTLTLYPEGTATSPINAPITLNSSRVDGVVETEGQVLIVILTRDGNQNQRQPRSLQFSWDSESPEDSALVQRSTNYLEGSTGHHVSDGFEEPNQKSVLVVNSGSSSELLDVDLKVDFNSCSLTNPCECSFFGLYEVLPNGALLEASRVCGRSVSSKISGLSGQLVALTFVHEPLSKSVEGAAVEAQVDIRWSAGSDNSGTTAPPPTTARPTTTLEPPTTIVCPEDATPCFCVRQGWGSIEIQCDRPTVTQESLYELFKNIREATGVSATDHIFVYYFELEDTLIEELDLTPFLNVSFQYLYISDNKNLKSIVGPPLDQLDGSIRVDYLKLQGSPLLTEAGLGDALKYFSHIGELELGGNALSELTFLQDLAPFEELRKLNLAFNNIGRLTDGQFRSSGLLHRLNHLYLNNNNMTEIAQGAFATDESSYSNPNSLNLHLDSNFLDEWTIHKNSGLGQLPRPTALTLRSNRITDLRYEVFEDFMWANDRRNVLALEFNPLICDQGSAWLKSQRENFENHVLDADCTNDVGHTVFTSCEIYSGQDNCDRVKGKA